jgi:hypothetical protein
MVGYVAVMETRNAYRIVRKPLGKCSLGRPRWQWKYNIEMDPREIGCKAEVEDHA